MQNQLEALSKAVSIAEAATHRLLKSHVSGYTRADGTAVQEHEDSRQAAQKKAVYEKLADKSQDATHKAFDDAHKGKLSGHKKAAEAHRKAMDAANDIGDKYHVKWHKDLIGYHEKRAGINIRTPERRLAARQ